MTNQTARLLRDAENYLSALHGSVARHDNLAANYGCAGCELRDQIREAMAAPVSSAGPAPATDRDGLRERIAAAIWERQNPGRRYADCEYRWQADAEADADAVLAVLPAPTDQAAELANLRTMYDAVSARESELIDERDKLIRWHREDGKALAEMRGTIERLRAELRRMAGEAQQDEAKS